MKFPPYIGQFAENTKTVHAVGLTALPGPRNTNPTGKFSIRMYRDHDDDAIDDNDREIPIFDEDDVTYTSIDRCSDVAGTGTALSLEIECIESRTDFRIKELTMQVIESGDISQDTSATA